ncbi:hypothetical protein [Methylomonas rhizoryzae]|uniref:hypothetical protein n=1 Tax=Methylomonas rhizoryzae TaxID=2608981 RepID=UPI001E426B5B|nr:hypothetical protein [Methylomonas rhizoryzae]
MLITVMTVPAQPARPYSRRRIVSLQIKAGKTSVILRYGVFQFLPDEENKNE